jgi:2-keto-4-pentenoate hydratase/2-oxohepta-3-ene-1,7-dioic acid hydratase in catechol pathway
MRFVSWRSEKGSDRGESFWGALLGDQVVPLGDSDSPSEPASLLAYVQQGSARKTWSEASLKQAAGGKAIPLAQVQLLAPIPRPAKNVFAVGQNYADHVREVTTPTPLPERPIYFTKPPTTVIGPDAAIDLSPDVTQMLDWEVELAVVVGRTARRVPESSALEYVFGYTVANDVSARDIQRTRGGQWFLGKALDTSCPLGPALVTADEIADPQALELSLTVNGVEKQRSTTASMIFSVAHIISDLSRALTLEAGDIILTGTPSGVGASRKPPEYLKEGDTVECRVEGIGTLRNTVSARR